MGLTRRGVVAGLAGCAAVGAAEASVSAETALAALEQAHGGQLAVCALDTGSGRALAHRADTRMVMCSTFKLLAAAAVLARVDAGTEQLGRRVAFGAADMLSHAPVTQAHVREGAMSVQALCAAAVEESDNTAANLLRASLGGPQGVTR